MLFWFLCVPFWQKCVSIVNTRKNNYFIKAQVRELLALTFLAINKHSPSYFRCPIYEIDIDFFHFYIFYKFYREYEDKVRKGCTRLTHTFVRMAHTKIRIAHMIYFFRLLALKNNKPVCYSDFSVCHSDKSVWCSV